MKPDELAVVAQLIRGQRQAALGTLRDGTPFASMVAYVAEPQFDGFLLHLSGLSPHTKHIQSDARTSLLINEQDDGREDVQTLARITLVGSTAMIPQDAADYEAARKRYLDRLPAAEMLFSFGDFALYRFTPTEARYIGGFARAFTLTVAHLRLAADDTVTR
jgi:hypothetical protein